MSFEESKEGGRHGEPPSSDPSAAHSPSLPSQLALPDWIYLSSLHQLAALRYKAGKYLEAEPLLRELVEALRTSVGENHADYPLALGELACVYQKLAKYSEALDCSRKALEINRGLTGKPDQKFARELTDVAILCYKLARYSEAESLLREALETTRATAGEMSGDFAAILDNQAAVYEAIGNYALAESLSARALQITGAIAGENSLDFAFILLNFSARCYQSARYIEMIEMSERALKIYRSKGATDAHCARALDNLGMAHMAIGNFAAAESYLRKALDLRVRDLGDNHSDVGRSLENLALLLTKIGDYAQGETRFKRAIELARQSSATSHPHFATTLHNLSRLYELWGNYARAIPLLEQALDLLRSTLGEKHPKFAASLVNLSSMYLGTGNTAEAERLVEQAREILGGPIGNYHPDYASSLDGLANVYKRLGDYVKAELCVTLAMASRRFTLGDEHLHFAQSLNNLAVLYTEMGRYSEAEPLLLQALAIRRKRLGAESSEIVETLNNLATLYASLGEFAKAEPILAQALDISKRVEGEYHPSVATILTNLAWLHVVTGREAQALSLMESAEEIYDRMIGQIFSIASENKRMAFLSLIQTLFFALLSLVSRHMPGSVHAVQVAWSVVVRRKALGAEALAAQRDAVLRGRYPSLEGKLRELNTLRMQIARAMLADQLLGDLSAQDLLTAWNTQKERLETELIRQIPEMNVTDTLATDPHTIALALPEGTTLIEFVRFDVIDFRAALAQGVSLRGPRYLAFVLSGAAAEVEMIDLGEAEPIDRMIASFREWITGERESRAEHDSMGASMGTGLRHDGSALREAVFDPLLAATCGNKRLLIAPDGDLTRLPFEVLPVGDGRLIDDYSISYLSVGRDLLRLGSGLTSQATAPLVVADPDFDLCDLAPSGSPTRASVDGGPRSGISRSLEGCRLHFGRLQGTRAEGSRIAEMLGVHPWMGEMALEAGIKSYRSPYILHMATHGFFLEDQLNKSRTAQLTVGVSEKDVNFSSAKRRELPYENPLLRSGLALAGANIWLRQGHPPPEAEDGFLTAEDVSGMDLIDTQLVVLSACETGLGEIRTGEGVLGLRRAFVLAGAQTLVMSLWKVPDSQTQELMEKFYSYILDGQARANALRRAQLEIRAEYPDPLYWGAFICQGDFRPLPMRPA